jgi:hypothetical protein
MIHCAVVVNDSGDTELVFIGCVRFALVGFLTHNSRARVFGGVRRDNKTLYIRQRRVGSRNP